MCDKSEWSELSMLTPKEVASETCKIGLAKVTKKNSQVIISAILAGMFIGLGYYGYIVLASGATGEFAFLGKFLGAFVFPIGLVLILIAGGDLFTGNCLITMGYFNKQYNLKIVIKNLYLVFIGNFIGALFLVGLMYLSNIITTDTKEYIIELAEKKVHLTFIEAVARGILCNILVALAVYISYSGKTISSRIIAAMLPVLLFVVSGYEHSIANMFLIPMAKVLGGEITVFQILFNNLLPVTIGNIIGGSIIIPLAYHYLFLKNHH
ncbi:MAG: FdhC protein [Haloplasmataceae bacterium]|jgi:formate/nitrite transporter|nr:FdhC protein [Haloplasmataceae bacterium]